MWRQCNLWRSFLLLETQPKELLKTEPMKIEMQLIANTNRKWVPMTFSHVAYQTKPVLMTFSYVAYQTKPVLMTFSHVAYQTKPVSMTFSHVAYQTKPVAMTFSGLLQHHFVSFKAFHSYPVVQMSMLQTQSTILQTNNSHIMEKTLNKRWSHFVRAKPHVASKSTKSTTGRSPTSRYSMVSCASLNNLM